MPGARSRPGRCPMRSPRSPASGPSSTAIPVEVTVDRRRPSPLHPEIEVALLRTAQEALANVAKHAGASRAVADPVVHGRRRDARRPRRRRRVQRRRAAVRRDGSGFGLTGDAAAGRPGRGVAGDRVRAGRRDGDLGARAGDRRRLVGRRAAPREPRSGCSSSTTTRSCATACAGMFAGDPDFEVVGEAADGAEALDARRARSRPDVILMDLRMPGVDGAAAIRELAERRIRGARARADHLRLGQRRRAGPRGRRDRLPAQGLAARGAAPRDPRRRPRRVRARAVGRHAAGEPAARARPRTRSATASSRCCR